MRARLFNTNKNFIFLSKSNLRNRYSLETSRESRGKRNLNLELDLNLIKQVYTYKAFALYSRLDLCEVPLAWYIPDLPENWNQLTPLVKKMVREGIDLFCFYTVYLQ